MQFNKNIEEDERRQYSLLFDQLIGPLLDQDNELVKTTKAIVGYLYQRSYLNSITLITVVLLNRFA